MAKQKSWQTKFEMLKELGEGGNAKVYLVRCIDNEEEFALKDLVVNTKEKRQRFIQEINIMSSNQSLITGILPIFEFCEDECWYTMPVAKQVIEYIKENELKIRDIILQSILLCQTLIELHRQGIAHRDIKPSNIYFYDERFYFGDFGLADMSDSTNDFTKSDKGLGAIFTIAPEMKRNPKCADSKKADVFSFAKTIWMLLTNNEKGFDGVYNYLDPNHSLRYMEKYRNTHLVELEELLTSATDNNPDNRPTIEEFKEKLSCWVEIYSDSEKSQASDWNFLNKQLFGTTNPDSSSWRGCEKIVNILNVIGSTQAYNHMMFHDKGGLDFSYAEVAAENECIKLYDTLGYCFLVKPLKLYFEGFDNNYKWNYFLLELDTLDPIFKHYDVDREFLVEDTPAHYVSSQFVQYGVYDYDSGMQLPEGYTTVYRYIKGRILIVMKYGPYNGIGGTYDGRHGDCSTDEFRKYIESLISRYNTIYEAIKKDKKLKEIQDSIIQDKILNLEEFNRNPFEKEVVKENEVQRIQRIEEKKRRKEFIEQNYFTWNFQDILAIDVVESHSPIKFIFRFKNFDEDNYLSEKQYYITTDGQIKNFDPKSEQKCYCVYDRNLAIQIKERLENKIISFINTNKFEEPDEYESFIQIEFVKIGKPLHLFTKKEIEEAMQAADDRVSNQLVIDENGYAKVIVNEGFGYLYPVRHESWDAGNVYVGKYSELLTLDDDYIASLQGWLSYLQTGKKVYMDYLRENRKEEDLIEEINKYYG